MPTKSGWTIGYYNKAVRKDMRKLPDPIRANFISIREKIEDEGLGEVPWHYIERIEGPDKLWELRLTGRGQIARALYVHWVGKRLIIVCVFEKKSQGIPKHILQLARKRAREVKNVW
ncbi:MAG: type II toxin-antitoxin system RelE/ParE family toxin [Proteobacteria bacterium]|nr:type II toxin-antitoxin system RelE/ParE family toxin [Pseudomonadota bacterium]